MAPTLILDTTIIQTMIIGVEGIIIGIRDTIITDHILMIESISILSNNLLIKMTSIRDLITIAAHITGMQEVGISNTRMIQGRDISMRRGMKEIETIWR
jgi:hypothetical protein